MCHPLRLQGLKLYTLYLLKRDPLWQSSMRVLLSALSLKQEMHICEHIVECG